MTRPTASEFPQELLDLYDDYAHGRIERRDFLRSASKFAVAGITAEMLLSRLTPNYSWAQQVAKDDPKIVAEYLDYDSPQGGGKMRGYLVRPKEAEGKLPAVLVIHENRGLNPYVEDVARRAAVAGFVALAPDGLAPVGGYPGNDDDGRALQSGLDQAKLRQDMVNSARYLKGHELSTGKLGATGFCWGGGMVNNLAVAMGADLGAGVPFYGAAPAAADVPKIKAPLLFNLAASDVHYLSEALLEFYGEKSSAALDAYSSRALARVWKAERFSWWMTKLLHRFPEEGDFGRRMQVAELDYLSGSVAAQTALAENYVGLPF